MFRDEERFKLTISQSGFGLPMALFVITVLAIIVTSMGSMQQMNAESGALHIQGERAFYAAESGLEAALNVLIPPDGNGGRSCGLVPFFEVDFDVPGLRGCEVSVVCSQMNIEGESLFTLHSVGRCGVGMDQATRTLELRAR